MNNTRTGSVQNKEEDPQNLSVENISESYLATCYLVIHRCSVVEVEKRKRELKRRKGLLSFENFK
jgi:hypothetical protein